MKRVFCWRQKLSSEVCFLFLPGDLKKKKKKHTIYKEIAITSIAITMTQNIKCF